MKTLTNRQFATFLLLSFAFCACSQPEKKKGYTIQGTITGIDSGRIVLSKNAPNDRSSIPVDSTEIMQGKFTFTGEVDSPEMMNLSIEPGGWGFRVFVENSEITIKADTTGARHYDWTSYGGIKGAEINNYSITGSSNQDQWVAYDKNPALKKFEPIFADLNERFESAKNKDEEYKLKEESDSIGNIFSGVQKKLLDSFVASNPSSVAAAYAFNNYYIFHRDIPLAEMERLLSTFDSSVKSSRYYVNLDKELKQRQALSPGQVAPDFTLLKRDSSSFTLSSLRGKVVLLDFWASWCIPCRKSIPHWKEVYKNYHDKGLEIVGVTNDSRWSDWFKALDQEKMPWLQVADEFPEKNMPSRVGTLYMTPYLPTYILLDKEGKIVVHNGSKEEIDNKLKELL